jgi:hypothetical protein
MSQPRRLKNLWASTACCRGSFTFFTFYRTCRKLCSCINGIISISTSRISSSSQPEGNFVDEMYETSSRMQGVISCLIGEPRILELNCKQDKHNQFCCQFVLGVIALFGFGITAANCNRPRTELRPNINQHESLKSVTTNLVTCYISWLYYRAIYGEQLKL